MKQIQVAQFKTVRQVLQQHEAELGMSDKNLPQICEVLFAREYDERTVDRAIADASELSLLTLPMPEICFANEIS